MLYIYIEFNNQKLATMKLSQLPKGQKFQVYFNNIVYKLIEVQEDEAIVHNGEYIVPMDADLEIIPEPKEVEDVKTEELSAADKFRKLQMNGITHFRHAF